jgi:disease resistance protein RPS2
MAGNLTGVDDLDEWKNTLKELKESKYSDMDEVFRILRFSYDRLYDLALQQCLLYCALFPEGQVIEREELISNLINVGIIERMESRQEALDKGHKMLNRLEGVCLLDRIDGGNAIKMHDLIRDMAIQIRKENPSVMVNFTFDPYFSFFFLYILTTNFFSTRICFDSFK